MIEHTPVMKRTRRTDCISYIPGNFVTYRTAEIARQVICAMVVSSARYSRICTFPLGTESSIRPRCVISVALAAAHLEIINSPSQDHAS